MMFRFLFFFLLTIVVSNSWAYNNIDKEVLVDVRLLQNSESDLEAFVLELYIDTVNNIRRPVKFKRGKAILLTVFTGLFGGHRIYFGTHERTPILYSITLGGLGILPIIDLINIIFTKDLSKFDDKPQIIMWGR